MEINSVFITSNAFLTAHMQDTLRVGKNIYKRTDTGKQVKYTLKINLMLK